MNDTEVRNIKDAWSLAMYFYNRKEEWSGENLTIHSVYNEEYQRWIRVWETLFNVAM